MLVVAPAQMSSPLLVVPFKNIVTRIAHRIGNGSYPLSHVHRSALILFNTVGLSTIR